MQKSDSPVESVSGDGKRNRNRGDYKGITDTDEILRLAYTELSKNHAWQTAIAHNFSIVVAI